MRNEAFPKRLFNAIGDRWREKSREAGTLAAALEVGSALWGFLRDSTPERRRRRYGDMEFDWEHRVDTTSGTVGWRERLLGVFLSPYQPTDPAEFREMMDRLPCDFREFTFIDLGSGKGRTLLMASGYPFRRIIGVEIVPELHRAAEENIRNYQSPTQRCRQIESICADAREFSLPEEPVLLYLFNPLPEIALREVLTRLETGPARSPRSLWIAYYNPQLETVLAAFPWLEKISERPNTAIYRTKNDAGNALQ